MPRTTVESLREQAKECLEASQRTDDQAVKDELLSAAVWLHEEAIKLEKLLNSPRGGGGGPGSKTKRNDNRKLRPSFARTPPRYNQPVSQIANGPVVVEEAIYGYDKSANDEKGYLRAELQGAYIPGRDAWSATASLTGSASFRR